MLDQYIDYDLAEYMVSDFSPKCLDMIELFLGRDVRNKLFVPVVDHVRPTIGYSPYAIQERPFALIGSGGRFSFAQAKEIEEAPEKETSISVSG